MVSQKKCLLQILAELFTFLVYLLPLSEATASCQDVVCPPGKTCHMKHVMCVRAPCDPIPVCEAPDAKPGTCPRVQLGDLGECINDCSTDHQCPGSQKCCSNGCGKICREPIMASPCPGLANGPCVEQCRQDGDCREGYTCCYNGCGHTCIRVVTGQFQKPGVCPWQFYQNPKERCGNPCDSDRDCIGLGKCCISRCGKSCRSPCFFYRNDSRGRPAESRNPAWTMSYFCGRQWEVYKR